MINYNEVLNDNDEMVNLYPYDPNFPSLFEDKYPLSWQMARWEKFAFIALLQKIRPKVAIEIGNAYGGSLQVLADCCDKVYAVDFQESVHNNLKTIFSDKVEFFTGDSGVIMPVLLKQIADKNEELGFVFIDGNHSTEGVKADINSILHHYIPVCDLVIIFHDSFHPACRRGIIEADWEKNPYVHYVDIDYIPGNFYKEKFGACEEGSLWNGLSMALLKPIKRNHILQVKSSLQNTYEQLYKASRYNSFRMRYFYPVKNIVKKIVFGK